MAGTRSGALVTNYPFLSIPYLFSKLLDSQQSSSYDCISPSFRVYLEIPTATCAQPVFRTASVAGNYAVMSPRGSPLNTGDSFAPSHPVISANRITGWKSVFAGMGLHVSRINDVCAYEDHMIREYLIRLVTRNNDCVARMRWTKNSVAIWNNSCVFHAATVCIIIPFVLSREGVSHILQN